jgi:DNA-binding CsgD family transcriptional regulator
MDRQSSPVQVSVLSPFPITRAGVVGLLAAAHECVTVVDARPSGDITTGYGLTDREASILALIASGMSNQDIATHLYLSVNSIKTYIRTAYRRIGARSRSEALLWALRHNLAEADPRSDVEDEPART